MIKKLFTALILLAILSCNAQNRDLIVIDKYFDSLYRVSEGRSSKRIITIDPAEPQEIDLNNYSSLTVSSLLYEKNYSLIEGFEGEIKVVDYYRELKKDNHTYLNPDYSKLIHDLKGFVLKDVNTKDIAFIIREGMNLEVVDNVFVVGRKTAKRDISSFINKSNALYWVVLDNVFISFINDELDKKNRVLIEADNLIPFYESILASVDKRLKEITLDGKSYTVEIKKR